MPKTSIQIKDGAYSSKSLYDLKLIYTVIGFTEDKLDQEIFRFSRVWSIHGENFNAVLEHHIKRQDMDIPMYSPNSTPDVRQSSLEHLFSLLIGFETETWFKTIRNRINAVIFSTWFEQEIQLRRKMYTF